jgi:glutamate-ammonia-ligase adenylyltransferase
LIDDSAGDTEAASIRFAAGVFARHFAKSVGAPEALAEVLRAEAGCSLNPRRALSLITRVAGSLDKETKPLTINEKELRALVRVCGVSEFFGEMMAGNPSLIQVLWPENKLLDPRFELSEFVSTDPKEATFAESLDALRRGWSRLFVEVGARDAQAPVAIEQVNRWLNTLAVSSLDASLLIARNELERRYGKLAAEPRWAVLGLGRLGSGGMDYGSDLDVIVVYDSTTPSPVAGATHETAYSRLTEFLVTALSSITHEGYLYRIDLRLRPDGQKGPLASGSRSFMNYLRTRASIWEWLAYVKLRAVAGDNDFGRALESSARDTVHELARQVDPAQLRAETQRVRNRLEKEKASRRTGINIKHGPGGMLDVYFATRYLQLRDNVMDHVDDRTTLRMLTSLREAGSISQQDHETLSAGYNLLRAVDHQLRLIVGRSATLPAVEQPAFGDIAQRLEFPTAGELASALVDRMQEIRTAYERIMRGEANQDGK